MLKCIYFLKKEFNNILDRDVLKNIYAIHNKDYKPET